ncbi:hypothetical protein Droror1_Dr00020046 [Drosera rotundifolia]
MNNSHMGLDHEIFNFPTHEKEEDEEEENEEDSVSEDSDDDDEEDAAGHGGRGKHLARAAITGAAIGDAPSPGGGGGKVVSTPSKRIKIMAEDEDAGTPKEQAEFLNEVETFYKEKALDFKAPKLYGERLNCL